MAAIGEVAGAGQRPVATPPAVIDSSSQTVEGDISETDVEAQEVGGLKDTKLDETKLPPYIPPPHFARYKHQMPDLLLINKDEGWYFTPMPLIGVDPDTGFNFGVGVDIYNNGSKDNPFFRITPYRQKISTQILATTTGVFQIDASYDNLYVMDSPWRVRGDAQLFYNPVKLYFGIGDAGTNLTYPGSNTVYGSFGAYNNALNQVVGGRSYSRYDKYGYSHLGFTGSAEYDMFGGLVRPLIGINISKIWIDDYSGRSFKGVVQESTHLRDDCNSGRAKGCKGGFDNFVKLGASFDTRNFEPDPSKGIMYQIVAELSPKFLGSAFNYGRLTTSLKGFGTLLKYKQQLAVLAARCTYSWQFGEIPFYSMNTLAFSEEDKTGLGGIETLRGYKLDRFIGPAAILTNVELRWSFVEFEVFKQYIKLMAVPFLDAGRVFQSVSATTIKDWKIGGGGGLHLAWNLSTVVSLDYGVSAEGSAFYMNLGHQF